MATQPLSPHCNLEEFLDFEETSDQRHEFLDGKIAPVLAGTETHSELSVSMTSVLRQHFFPKCRVYDSRLMLHIAMIGRPVYPDAMVLCGEPEYFEGRRTVITNPSLVVEVLSPSSGKYDRGPKTDYYRSVPSVRDILLLHQDKHLVEHFERVSIQWTITPYSAGMVFPVRDITLSVSEIYEGILSV